MPTTDRPELDHDELREYVDAFKTSSDRSRNALYVVIVATLLIVIAHYNTLPWSFARHRVRHWYEIYQIAKRNHSLVPETILDGDFDQLRVASEEYLRQYTDRATLATSPIPGVWVDANDIGLFGGIILLMLMGVLAVCMRREHDNLHLSLYKVRRLYDLEVKKHDGSKLQLNPGDSVSNFLYHALAMRQVLSTPPTLARKESLFHNVSNAALFSLAFLFPAFGYGFVVLTNRATNAIGEQYDMNISLLNVVQCILLLGIFFSCLLAIRHSFGMSKQWKGAFLRINHHRRLREHASGPKFKSVEHAGDTSTSPEVPTVVHPPTRKSQWLSFPWTSSQEKYWVKRIAVALTESLHDRDNPFPARDLPIPKISIPATAPITRQDLTNMARKIIDFVTKDAKCTSRQLSRDGSLVLNVNHLKDGEWIIAGQWVVRPNPSLATAHAETSE